MPTLNPWLITDTYTLLGTVEQIKQPASYLADTFFPKRMPVSYTNWVSVEYRKEGRMLAPVKPEDRAARMQANDLVELLRLNQNTKNKQAADILQTGQTTIRGYADDGKTVEEDTIIFDWNGAVTPATNWDQAGATIYDDIKAVSDRIQEDSGFIPTLMLCGRNVEKYLLNNDELFKWMSLPNRQNVTMLSFAPHYTSPQARFVGHISSLNLEIISYSETYTDDDGVTKPFIDPDTVIIANPGKGKQLYGAVTFMNQQGDWQTIVAENVPVYIADPTAQQSSLTIYSRFLLVPEIMDDWAVIKTKG